MSSKIAPPSGFRTRVRYVLSWLAEFVFITDAMAVVLLGAGVVIGGFNPLDSSPILWLAFASMVIASIHHRWYRRHRTEIETGWDHQHNRERRGF